MSNLVVRYNNDMNGISFRQFNQVELDLFFTICASIKEKGTNEITFDFEKLKELSNYDIRNLKRFTTDLERTNEKLMKLIYRIEDDKTIIQFVLFPFFKIDKERHTVTIAVNESFKYILNELTSDFTRFELKEFTSLKSTYSKAMYRLLKQFRSTGYYKVSVNEFIRLLDIPASYKMSHINDNVLKTILNELPYYFKNLKLKKIKAKKGKKIEYFEFSFEKEMIYQNGEYIYFKDDDQNYYSKSIYDLTVNEIKEKFPENEIDENQISFFD